MNDQQRVAQFIETHELDAPPAYRLLDLVSELGEVAKDAAESTAYGQEPDALTVNADEVGDTLFALLAFADSVEIDASGALSEALEKYEQRLKESGSAASGV